MSRNEIRAIHHERTTTREVDSDGADRPSSPQPPDSGVHACRPTSVNVGALEAGPDMLLQAARICLRRGRAKDAITLMRQACGAAPHHLQCQALFAWLRVQRGEVRPTGAQPIVDLLSAAVRQYPEDLESRLYRARTLQRIGRRAEALLDFAFVANADPLNVEAARELGLASGALGPETDTVGAGCKPFNRAESRPAARQTSRAPAESTPSEPDTRAAPTSGFFPGRARPR